jgi:2,3-bisphosphoglycerate-independent phosphoglycerate mutase
MANEKVAVLIIDGLGFDTPLEQRIMSEVVNRLPPQVTGLLIDKAQAVVDQLQLDEATGRLIPAALLVPTMTSLLADTSLWSDHRAMTVLNTARDELRAAIGPRVWEEEVLSRLKAAAARNHYAPWVASTTTLWNLRNTFTTFPTRAAGVFAGFENLDPEIMGNSDTGHQQISNLTVAKQVPTWITEMIEDGSLFEDQKLVGAMQRARDGHLVVIKTMLSGEFGDDGYVHSALRHLWALLDLYFNRLQLPKENLQLEIALDGRDSPDRSSTDEDEIDGVHRFDFLGKLKRHLVENYDALECVAWIFGRQHMDRNYQGAMIRGEYEMVVKNVGERVDSFDQAYDLIKQLHDQGLTDPMIPPIVIGQARTVDGNTSFINAIFRADRQEPITATLLGLKDFVSQRAEPYGTLDSWEGFDWLEDLSGLTMVTMIDYHAAFAEAGVGAVVLDRPHEHNMLYLMNEFVEGFQFLFLGESVKAKHIGLFSRGRRSLPLKPAEDRKIIPSYGKKEDVANDNELYKFPSMRHLELGAELEKAGREAKHDFILVNWPGPDMIGHLITKRFESCVETINSIESVLNKVVPVLRGAGYFVIITADHGNVENYGPDHGNNSVLTTIVPPAGREDAIVARFDQWARLFDIAATALSLMGHDQTVRSQMPPIPENIQQSPNRLVGVPLISVGG